MKRLLLVALMVLVTLVGMVGFSRAASDLAMQSVITQLKNIQQSLDAISNAFTALQASTDPTFGAVTELFETVNADVPVKPKMYYLTKNTFDGGDAIKACDPRFHMASISEIQDPSNLQYVNRSTSVYDSLIDDEGLGPPSNHMGWVRPGFSAALPADLLPMAQTNCDLSATRTREVFGTTVHIPSPNVVPITNPWDQITNPDALTLWIASPTPCEASVRVWCVEDPE